MSVASCGNSPVWYISAVVGLKDVCRALNLINMQFLQYCTSTRARYFDAFKIPLNAPNHMCYLKFLPFSCYLVLGLVTKPQIFSVYVLAICMCVSLSVNNITQKTMDDS